MLSVGQLAILRWETLGSELAEFYCFPLFPSVRLLNDNTAFSLNYGCELKCIKILYNRLININIRRKHKHIYKYFKLCNLTIIT